LTNVNEAPTINAQSFSVAENSISGAAIGTVVATDSDASQTLTYSITSGNTNNAFAINPSTGALTVATSSALNFESTQSYALIVSATDNGSPILNSQATVTITVTNVNEAPIINAQTFSIALHSPEQKIIFFSPSTLSTLQSLVFCTPRRLKSET
jgi:VCBS repeat-containing protein